MAEIGSTQRAAADAQPSLIDGSTLQNVKDTAVNTAQQAFSSIQNSSTVQNLANGQILSSFASCKLYILNFRLGPVAENVKVQASKTQGEIQNLANARVQPDQPAATGQPLTHYHSMFYSLLSWENPRATSLAFASTVAFIFMTRYLNVLHYLFKFSYFILGVTATMEIAGKLIFNDGLASKMRPRKYWTIPKESLERNLDDVEQLLNFFVIEAQRIVYAENVYATIAVFGAALVSYWLIKVVPFWGLTLIGTVVLYSAPLIYISNREAIDSSVDQVTNIVSSQATQIRDMTAQHAATATDALKSTAGQYTSMAQDYMGTKRTASPASNQKTVNPSDFPVAPKQEPLIEPVNIKQEQEPLLSH